MPPGGRGSRWDNSTAAKRTPQPQNTRDFSSVLRQQRCSIRTRESAAAWRQSLVSECVDGTLEVPGVSNADPPRWRHAGTKSGLPLPCLPAGTRPRWIDADDDRRAVAHHEEPAEDRSETMITHHVLKCAHQSG